MKKLIIKTTSLIAAVTLTVVIFFVIPGAYDNPLASFVNKMHRLKQTASPKIVLVGGSDVIIGINSPLINKELGYHVVNMGLYGAFGIRHMLHLIGPYIHAGDVVIILADHEALQYDLVTDDFSAKWIFLLSPCFGLKDIYLKQNKLQALPGDIADILLSKVAGMWKTLWSGGNIFEDGAASYSKRCNVHGDLMVNWTTLPKEQLQFYGDVLTNTKMTDRVFEILNGFNAMAAARGARVFLSYSSYPDGEFQRNREQILSREKQLHERLQFGILGTPQDFLFPYGYFTNSIFHLNADGRDIRTRKLIELLRKEGIQNVMKNGGNKVPL